MAGYGDMLKKQAYEVGNQWGSEYDRAMGTQQNPNQMPTGMMPMFGQDPIASTSYPGSSTINRVQSGAAADPTRGGGLNVGPGFSQFMNMAKAPDMSQPQQAQGQDIMSLIQMLQGGQQPRGGRNARR